MRTVCTHNLGCIEVLSPIAQIWNVIVKERTAPEHLQGVDLLKELQEQHLHDARHYLASSKGLLSDNHGFEDIPLKETEMSTNYEALAFDAAGVIISPVSQDAYEYTKDVVHEASIKLVNSDAKDMTPNTLLKSGCILHAAFNVSRVHAHHGESHAFTTLSLHSQITDSTEFMSLRTETAPCTRGTRLPKRLRQYAITCEPARLTARLQVKATLTGAAGRGLNYTSAMADRQMLLICNHSWGWAKAVCGASYRVQPRCEKHGHRQTIGIVHVCLSVASYATYHDRR